MAKTNQELFILFAQLLASSQLLYRQSHQQFIFLKIKIDTTKINMFGNQQPITAKQALKTFSPFISPHPHLKNPLRQFFLVNIKQKIDCRTIPTLKPKPPCEWLGISIAFALTSSGFIYLLNQAQRMRL